MPAKTTEQFFSGILLELGYRVVVDMEVGLGVAALEVDGGNIIGDTCESWGVVSTKVELLLLVPNVCFIPAGANVESYTAEGAGIVVLALFGGSSGLASSGVTTGHKLFVVFVSGTTAFSGQWWLGFCF